MCRNPIKILIVEDEKLTSKIFRHILDKLAIEYRLVDNGDKAIATIPDYQPDIILSDVSMPYKSGLDVLRFVKQQHKEIPFVVVSSHGENGKVVTKAFDLGADDFITKPFSPEDLLACINRILPKAQLT